MAEPSKTKKAPSRPARQNSVPEGGTVADILQAQGLLTAEQVSDLKMEQIQFGRPIEDIISERALVPPRELAQARAQFWGIPYAELEAMQIPAEVLDLIPQAVAKRNLLIPISKEGNVLSLAMWDPLDLQIIEFIERSTQMTVKPYHAEKEAIERAIETQYQRTLGKEVTEALEEVGGPIKLEEAKDIEKEAGVIRKSPVADIVSSILRYAARSGASDVHIEPSEGKTRVRYRIDGVLHERLTLPTELHSSIVSRIKILSNLKIDEKRVPQDGRFKIEFFYNADFSRGKSCHPAFRGDGVNSLFPRFGSSRRGAEAHGGGSAPPQRNYLHHRPYRFR
jgi:type IV pilus assembly protein PilB